MLFSKLGCLEGKFDDIGRKCLIFSDSRMIRVFLEVSMEAVADLRKRAQVAKF